MRIVTYIFLLAILLLGISFAILNAEPVKINYYVGTRDMALSMLLVISLGFGIILGLMSAFMMLLSLKRKNHQLQKRIKQVEKS